jgi:drug/metabolite transporter (DMT)-like permease
MAVLCSSAVAVLLRVSGRMGLRKLEVIAVNYITAIFVSLLLQGGGIGDSFGTLETAIRQVISHGGSMPDQHREVLWGMAVGIPLGIIYFLAFIVYQRALRENGLGLSGGFAKMGILLPMALSMLIWGEFPQALQWAGIAVAVAAVFIGAFRGASGGVGRFTPVLLLVFLANGMAEFGSKVYQNLGGGDNREFFLLWVFGVAFLCSVPGIVRSGRTEQARHRLNPLSAALGVPLGLVNYFSSWFLIHALGELNASVVFSVFGAGTVALLSLTGVAAFGERLDGRRWASLVMVTASLVLVNL